MILRTLTQIGLWDSRSSAECDHQPCKPSRNWFFKVRAVVPSGWVLVSCSFMEIPFIACCRSNRMA